jgi:tetratricopeptide (TPR) repeat protein
MIDDYEADITRYKRSSAGFLTLAAILLILLIPLTIFAVKNYGKVKAIEQDYALLQSARSLFEEQNTMLQRDAESLVKELETYKGKNDTMMQRYQEAVVMLEQLQKEKTYSYNQLAKYRKEVDMLKGVMKGYIRKIDSLNDINTNLKAMNVEYEKERKSFKERAEKAEEKADELKTKVRIGSVIRTGGVRLVALNDNGKPVKRVKVASRLRVDFELTANELAEPGEKTIYVCITDPEGYVLSPASKMIPFTFEGEGLTASAMRKVSYENESVPVSIFYDGSAFQKGTYKVDIYIDGRHCGSGTTYFE